MAEEPARPKTSRGALTTALTGALLTATLGILFAGGRTGSAFDDAVRHSISGELGDQPRLLRVLVLPTQPYVLVPALVLVAVVRVLRRDRPGAVLTAAGPAFVVAVNTWVLKPLFDRRTHDYLAYPSGHTVSLVATVTVFALLVRTILARWTVVAAGALLTVTAGTGMIGLGYHYATDVLGGAGFAVAGVLLMAVLVGRWLPAPAGRSA